MNSFFLIIICSQNTNFIDNHHCQRDIAGGKIRSQIPQDRIPKRGQEGYNFSEIGTPPPHPPAGKTLKYVPNCQKSPKIAQKRKYFKKCQKLYEANNFCDSMGRIFVFVGGGDLGIFRAWGESPHLPLVLENSAS